MQRDHWLSAARHRNQLGKPEDIGRKAAERALRSGEPDPPAAPLHAGVSESSE